MAYNTRRSGGEAINNVGARRNPPITNNFIPGGQLAPQNRPPHQPPRPQSFQSQSNGNFRPQMQQRMQAPRPPAQTPQKMQQQQIQQQQQQIQPQSKPTPPPQHQPPPQQRQPPPQQHQPPPQQHQPPPQQHQPPPQQHQPPPQQHQPPPQMNVNAKMEEDVVGETGEEQTKRRPYWATKGKISRKERQRRRNLRLSKILQPKNAVMILNELVKSATYTVTDLPQPSEMNQYTATVLVDGISHIGHGRSKMEAKSQAAENALKYIVKNRQFSALKKDEDGDEKMEIADESSTLPWQHVASFALYKLLNAWGEDPNQARGLTQQLQENAAGQPLQNRPAKKMPENAAHMNPLMLLNQMLPHAQFEELGRNGNPPNVIFTFKCVVDGQNFTGSGPNKKSAKRMAAFAVCNKILNIQYPPEIFAPSN